MSEVAIPKEIRNVAIVAHVDHGKTTLVDFLLKQAGTFRENEAVSDRVMDSGDLERERGITITAKNTAVRYKDYKINIVDTPGHADFGGEVERILSMVDGVCLLVDAAEGPLPQTRFVLQKALAQNLKVLVVVNKIDRPDARPQEVLNEVFNLFIDLGADDEQADFPVVYTIAKDGKASKDPDAVTSADNLEVLYEEIVRYIPAPPKGRIEEARMLIANLGYSEYLGRLAIGRVESGVLRTGNQVAIASINAKGEPSVTRKKVSGLFTYEGLEQVQAEAVYTGDIAILSGYEEIKLGDTVLGIPEGAGSQWDPSPVVLPRLTIDEPTLSVEWSVNNSPLAGTEGEHVTSRKIRDRLLKETLTNVALRFEDTDSPERFNLKGRGEFQMAILAEQLRREGYEFSLSQPRILYKEIDGQLMEPMELAILDVPEFSQGTITQMFQIRKGILQNIEARGAGRVRIEILIPSRGLIGLRSRFMTETKGEGLFSCQAAGFEPHKGDISQRQNGALVCDRAGESNAYGMEGLQARGVLIIGAQTKVYEGMIIGENSKTGDLWVNPVRAKQLTNFRTANKDDAITLSPPRLLTLETGIEWVGSDELLEVTPKSIRARKKHLSKQGQPKSKLSA